MARDLLPDLALAGFGIADVTRPIELQVAFLHGFPPFNAAVPMQSSASSLSRILHGFIAKTAFASFLKSNLLRH